MVAYPKATDLQQSPMIGTWGETDIPVYEIPSMHALNQVVGYIKHINAGNGTVLYRGQCELYESVIPSIKHCMSEIEYHEGRLKDAISASIEDDPFRKFLGLRNSDIDGWKLYEKLIVEAVFQHYGAKTYCVDFVDNHWTALWFGLYEWDAKKKKYKCREHKGKAKLSPYITKSDRIAKQELPLKPCLESVVLSEEKIQILKECASHGSITLDELIKRNTRTKYEAQCRSWEAECKKIKQYNQEIDEIINAEHLYMFLYVAETNTSNIHGVYLGENTYTIDLRKALPSTFLRPCSQHGWIVRGKDCSYDFNSKIACVLQISVSLVIEMLGNGALLSQENFFPNEKIDQGYRILLMRQEGSRLESDNPKILPENMITDFE